MRRRADEHSLVLEKSVAKSMQLRYPSDGSRGLTMVPAVVEWCAALMLDSHRFRERPSTRRAGLAGRDASAPPP